MRKTTRKLLLSTAVLLAGVGVASAQGMHEGAGGGAGGGAAAGISGGGGPAGAGASGNLHGAAGVQSGGNHEGRASGATIGQAQSHANAPGAAQTEHGSERGKALGGMNAGEHQRTVGQASHEEDAQQSEQAREHGQVSGNAHGNMSTRQHHSTVGHASNAHNASQTEHGRMHNRAQGNAQIKAQGNAKAGDHQRTVGQAAQQQNAISAQQNADTRQHAQTPNGTTTGQATSRRQGGTSVPTQANVGGQYQAGASVQQNGGNRVQLSSQQRSQIRDTVLSRGNVPRVNHVDFALRTGAIVPERVHFARISEFPELVDVFPEYRSDDFFVSEDEIVILSPQRRVVEVVPLNGSRQVGAISEGRGGVVELSSAEIREVQEVLVARGYDVQVDGLWGPSTREALITFQRREGLPATGVISTRTVASLGLRGRIAASHIQGGASTVGQANEREHGQFGPERDRLNAQQGRDRFENRNASAPHNNRSTVGQARDNDNQPNTQRGDRLSPYRSTIGQGRSDEQNERLNGQRDSQSEPAGGQANPRSHATVGQSGRSEPRANAGDQLRGDENNVGSGNMGQGQRGMGQGNSPRR